jgi:hypothetical protein
VLRISIKDLSLSSSKAEDCFKVANALHKSLVILYEPSPAIVGKDQFQVKLDSISVVAQAAATIEGLPAITSRPESFNFF